MDDDDERERGDETPQFDPGEEAELADMIAWEFPEPPIDYDAVPF